MPKNLPNIVYNLMLSVGWVAFKIAGKNKKTKQKRSNCKMCPQKAISMCTCWFILNCSNKIDPSNFLIIYRKISPGRYFFTVGHLLRFCTSVRFFGSTCTLEKDTTTFCVPVARDLRVSDRRSKDPFVFFLVLVIFPRLFWFRDITWWLQPEKK